MIAGASAVDQAPITGESHPVLRTVGDSLFAGSINGEGLLEERSTRPACDTMLARMERLGAEAQSRRARVEQWVARFARVYTPAVLVAALLTFSLPPLLFAGD